MYRRSPLSPWFSKVEVDSFHPGSVLVYYILQLKGVSALTDTVDIIEYVNNQISQDGFGHFSIDPNATDFVGMYFISQIYVSFLTRVCISVGSQ